MAKLMFFISTAIIALIPSCEPFDLSNAHQKLVTDCMFGPFKDSALECVRRHHKFTGCILENLNWFHKSGALSKTRVRDGFREYVINDNFWSKVRYPLIRCVVTANSHRLPRDETADKFVECLDKWNAFAGIFPKIFCGRNDSINNHTVPHRVKIHADTCAFNRTAEEFVACFRNSSSPNKLRTSRLHSCSFGPFKKNVRSCLISRHRVDECFLQNLGYFTEDDKIDITKLLNSMRRYIVNPKPAKVIDDITRECVTEVNRIGRTAMEVGNHLVNCWMKKSTFVLFHDAFCSKKTTIFRSVPN